MDKKRAFNISILPMFSAFLFFGCSKDDDTQPQEETDPLYENVLVSADASKLLGLWSIFEGSLQGESIDIPENNPTCGRDFFSYSANGAYMEYEITDNFECTPQVNQFRWNLENGILTYSEVSGETLELVVVELTDNKFVFKADIDYDENGTSDIFTFTARRYNPPNDMDIYSFTFNRDLVIPHYDKIRFSWRTYQGFNTFQRYEIFRSKDGCTKADAQLITTLVDRETDFFIDENPSPEPELCYFFKLYTDMGLLSESDLIMVNPNGLDVALVDMGRPVVSQQAITLNWSRYGGFYFSHYEITVRNYEEGSGYGYQEEIIANVTDINTLSFDDTDPPYLSNPVYAVHVVDIFGNRSNGAVQGKNSCTLEYKRPEVIELDFVRQVVHDTNEPMLYLYGRSVDGGLENFYKFNYGTNTMVAISDEPPNTSSEGTMKLVVSDFGKELILPVGNELRVYNASNLIYKYRIEPQTGYINDFEYLGNGIWSIADSDRIYTFTRDGQKLIETAQEVHFSEHQSSGSYQILQLGNNFVVVGHANEPKSLTFKIGSNGILTDRKEINQVIHSEKETDTRYVPPKNIIVDLKEFDVYSTTDFSSIQTFRAAFFPNGISTDGTFILGTPNDPAWEPDDVSQHEKKISWYNLDDGSLNTKESKGYSQVIFQNYLGQYISISSGFKRRGLADYTPKADIFVEIIEP